MSNRRHLKDVTQWVSTGTGNDRQHQKRIQAEPTESEAEKFKRFNEALKKQLVENGERFKLFQAELFRVNSLLGQSERDKAELSDKYEELKTNYVQFGTHYRLKVKMQGDTITELTEKLEAEQVKNADLNASLTAKDLELSEMRRQLEMRRVAEESVVGEQMEDDNRPEAVREENNATAPIVFPKYKRGMSCPLKCGQVFYAKNNKSLRHHLSARICQMSAAARKTNICPKCSQGFVQQIRLEDHEANCH